ncbi:uncharacterized protein LOC113777959 [Coffea eugenioides]|uniref:Uncharacterized protein n=1 Tax=Coffea arabica TaxID=13443 RepID=A0ABM4V970_COFAR|nr:uncharacterized protein LOC113699457 [Coffea arabica]XP_027178996.1 uncharacterized protein LOC113777959 [Coffea eugenioides]
MLRALSTRNGRRYEKIEEGGQSSAVLEAQLNKSRSLPAKLFGSQQKSTRGQTAEEKSAAKQARTVSKIHPMFNLFDPRLRKKATANPEFSRYLEYLKEEGTAGLGPTPNMPVIHET